MFYGKCWSCVGFLSRTPAQASKMFSGAWRECHSFQSHRFRVLVGIWTKVVVGTQPTILPVCFPASSPLRRFVVSGVPSECVVPFYLCEGSVHDEAWAFASSPSDGRLPSDFSLSNTSGLYPRTPKEPQGPVGPGELMPQDDNSPNPIPRLPSTGEHSDHFQDDRKCENQSKVTVSVQRWARGSWVPTSSRARWKTIGRPNLAREDRKSSALKCGETFPDEFPVSSL